MHWFDDAEEEAVVHGGFSFTERRCALRVVTTITITGPRAWPEKLLAERAAERAEKPPEEHAGHDLGWQDEPPR